MSKFTTSLDWCVLEHGVEYISTKDLHFELGLKGSGLVYVVPKGYKFELSVPSFLWWLVDPHNPKYLKSAAVHDHMLEDGWDRPTSGAAFHAALKASGVGRFKRLIMFFAVTLWRWR